MAEDNKRKREIEKRLDDLGKLMQKIYEDRVLGNMPDKACAELLGQYQQEKEDLQAELNELRKRFDGYKREEEDVDEFIRRLKSYAGAEELTRQMCLELIEYVTIGTFFLICVCGTLCGIECGIEILHRCKSMLSDDTR